MPASIRQRLLNLSRGRGETFERRGTALPWATPTALTEAFARDVDKVRQWNAFLSRNGLDLTEADLPHVVGQIRLFLIPPISAALDRQEFAQVWPAGGPWATPAGGAAGP